MRFKSPMVIWKRGWRVGKRSGSNKD